VAKSATQISTPLGVTPRSGDLSGVLTIRPKQLNDVTHLFIHYTIR